MWDFIEFQQRLFREKMSNYSLTGVHSAVSQMLARREKHFDNISSRRVARVLRGITFFPHKNERFRYYLKLK